MLILFDQGTPTPIRPFLKGHLVRTAAQQGWSDLVNGNLLNAAEKAGFQLLLTMDKNMSYQQNLAGRTIALIVLSQQQWPTVRPHVRLVVDAVNAAAPGSFTKIFIPQPKA